MTWQLRSFLPDDIVEVAYSTRNHHISLVNRLGQEIKLDATSLVKYTCCKCGNAFFTASNHGSMKCPLCGGDLKTEWGRLQICFIPEKETDFEVDHGPKKTSAS